MSLILTNQDKIKLLEKQKLHITQEYLINYLNNIKTRTLNYINLLLKFDNIKINNDNCVNPPLWQFGHIIDFYLKNTLDLLNIKSNLQYNILNTYIKQIETTYNIKFELFFDSYYTPRHIRFSKNLCYNRLNIIY